MLVRCEIILSKSGKLRHTIILDAEARERICLLNDLIANFSRETTNSYDSYLSFDERQLLKQIVDADKSSISIVIESEDFVLSEAVEFNAKVGKIVNLATRYSYLSEGITLTIRGR